MKYKIKEPKKLVAIFLIVYIVLSLFFIANNVSERMKETPTGITGNAAGTVKIFLGNITTITPIECVAPNAPTLNPVSDTRSNSVTMSWTSHKNSTQSDRFIFDDEGLVSANSPQTKSRL